MGAKRVRTTFGKTVEVDARELEDLRRQGLIASKPPRETAAAPAAADDADAPAAEADNEGSA